MSKPRWKTLRVWLLWACALAWLGCTPAAPLNPAPRSAGDAQTAAATHVERRLPTGGGPGVAVGTHGAVASAEGHASRVALDVLRSGGNAVDAAVALAFALAVTHPTAGNLGGGGFMLLRMAAPHGARAEAAEVSAIDYRETAPLAASRDMYLDASGALTKDSVIGPRAAGVPGTVAGLELAHARYGSKPWAELVAPAIALARDGHAIDPDHAKSMAEGAERMRAAGFASSAAHYLGADAAPLAAGAVWKQPELAQTLSEIAAAPGSFYRGALGQRLAKQMQAQGGLWTEQDLAEYRALQRTPLRFSYLGHEIITMPLPSAGGIVMRQILFASELLEMRKHPYRSAAAYHLYLEAARRAYADRNTYLGDPDFVKAPSTGLLSPDYLRARMQTIDPDHATPSSALTAGSPRAESPETTHFSVVDDFGNAVSNTFTLNAGFGAKVVLEGTGILLNDEMDDFASNPGKPNAYGLVQGEANKIEPKKRMLSSMTPTIILKDGQLRAVVGTPGGPTITTTVVQLVRGLIDYGVTLDVAVAAPRAHHQWLPDQVIAEPDFEPEIVEGLKSRGHNVMFSPWGKIGHADSIEVDPATQGFRAVADVTRGGGGAEAY